MKYIDFLNKFKDSGIIDLSNIRTIFPDFNSRRLYEWQKSGKIKKVSNGYYIFADKKLLENDVNLIANKLYEPSYLSLEYALNYYSLIPEAVFVKTSISPKKTTKRETAVGNFSYRSVKENLFFGYTLKGEENSRFKIAEPEKALLDFLYLRADIKNLADIESLRINKERYREIINEEKLNTYLKQFDSKTLNKKIEILKDYILNFKEYIEQKL